MNKHHEVKGVYFKNGKMTLCIDGIPHIFILSAMSPKLACATLNDRMNFEISPSVYGIHWPTLDEDLSIDGLLGIVHAPQHINKAAS